MFETKQVTVAIVTRAGSRWVIPADDFAILEDLGQTGWQVMSSTLIQLLDTSPQMVMLLQREVGVDSTG